jgi:uncharacterized protein with HEPN domain
MRREPRAYLADAVAACDAIALHLTGIELGTYLETRVIRSAVEREFIIIGEAIRALGSVDQGLFSRISQARKVVDFRNQLTHGYMTVNDKLVWAYGVRYAPRLRDECAAMLAELDPRGTD